MVWTNTTKHVPTATRRRILNRDGHQCAQCGHHDPTATTLEIDHIDNRRGPTYGLDVNLQTLCRPCHRAKTQREMKRGKEQKRARRYLPRTPHPGLS